MFDQIEKLQTDYTDKYVVVDATIAELARFEGYVGQIKTINMSGRALVQFDAWNNIGWYDIDVACLTVVPKPEEGAEAKKHDIKKQAPRPATNPEAKTTGEGGGKKLSPLEMARQQGAAKPAGAAAGGAKQSTADILAAARANKAGSAAPTAAPKAEAKAAPAAKPAGGKLSTADILAAARANKEGGAPAAPAASAAPAEAEPVVEAAAPAAKPAAKSGGATGLPAGRRATVPEILAWCREHDAH